MEIPSYCYRCEKVVAAHPWLTTDDAFWAAIKTDDEVEVGHTVYGEQHIWNLKTYERHALRKQKGIGV
jgi:hypothetical protein